jgi:hypothetical protein
MKLKLKQLKYSVTMSPANRAAPRPGSIVIACVSRRTDLRDDPVRASPICRYEPQIVCVVLRLQVQE